MTHFQTFTTALLLGTALGGPGQAQSADTEMMMSDEIIERLDRQGELVPLMVANADSMAESMGAELPALALDPATGDEMASATGDDMAAAMAEYASLPDAARIGFRIQFALDSASLLPAATPQLTQVCMALQQRPDMQLRIFGHTDTSGPAGYNAGLSEARAEAVRAFLVASCGIAETRLMTFGLGETAPLPDRAGTARENRRVEFQLAG